MNLHYFSRHYALSLQSDLNHPQYKQYFPLIEQQGYTVRGQWQKKVNIYSLWDLDSKQYALLSGEVVTSHLKFGIQVEWL